MFGRRSSVRSVALAMTALLAVVACSSDDDGEADAPAAPSTTVEETTARTETTVVTGPLEPSETTEPATTEPVEPARELDWATCTEEGFEEFECATIEVPQDWADPDGETIEVAMLRTPVENPERTLFVNFGGPGASGFGSLRTSRDAIVAAVGEETQVVSWDPRGLARSTPLACTEGNAEFYTADPSTPEGIDTMLAAVQERARICAERYGDFVGQVGTIQGARDLDAMRAAMGEDRLDFLGLSYGTRVGSVYAALFPDRVGNMVLDGSLAPTSTMLSTAEGNVIAFDAALREWFAQCANRPPCALGDDPAAGFTALLEQIRANPPVVPGTGEVMTPGLFNQIVLVGIANFQESALAAEQVIADFKATGDPTAMFQLASAASGRQPDGTYSNSQAIFQFVNCQDWYDRPSPTEVHDAARRAAAASPEVGAFAIAFSYLPNAGCPAPASSTPLATAADLPPILIVGSTTDAETPLQWSQELSGHLPNSRLLVSQTFGHTAFFANPCVAEATGTFIRTGELPAPGTVCPPP